MTNSISKQEYTTVGDLIDQLKQFDLELPVATRFPDTWIGAGKLSTIGHPLISMDRSTMNLGNTGFRPCVEIRITDGEND